jgi:AcrR family transcriptional regulator
MAQTKKDGVRDAILAAAFARFSEKGYSETTIPAIAAGAGISTANVYRYFPSKLEILYTLYEPWLLERFPIRGVAWSGCCSLSGANSRQRRRALQTTSCRRFRRRDVGTNTTPGCGSVSRRASRLGWPTL